MNSQKGSKIYKGFRLKFTIIEKSKDLDSVKIEELVGSIQTYELKLPQFKKNKFIVFNTIKEGNCDKSDDKTLVDEKLEYLLINSTIFLGITRNLFPSSHESDSNQYQATCPLSIVFKKYF